VAKFRTQAPWEYLLSASRNTLQSYELSRLAHAANLRKEISELLDQWLEENTSAMVARCLMEQRERSACVPPASPNPEAASAEGQSVSDNVFADRLVPPRPARGRP